MGLKREIPFSIEEEINWGLFNKEGFNSIEERNFITEVIQPLKKPFYTSRIMELPNNIILRKPIILLCFQDSRNKKNRDFPKEFYNLNITLEKIKNEGNFETLLLPDTSPKEIAQVLIDQKYPQKIKAIFFAANKRNSNLFLKSIKSLNCESLELLFINSTIASEELDDFQKNNLVNIIHLDDTSEQENDIITTNFPSRFFYGLAGGITIQEAFNNARNYVNSLFSQSKEENFLYSIRKTAPGNHENWVLEESLVQLSLNQYHIPKELRTGKLAKIEEYIDSIPYEIAQAGPDAIKTYQESIKNEANRTFNYEGKLIFIGQGGVGKTSLSKKIRDPNFKVKAKEKVTKGMDTRSWTFSLDIINNSGEKEKVPFKFNIWDFGGQEMYRSIQQLFITDNSIYIFVTAAREYNPISDVLWLQTVSSKTKNSPIIHVLNKIDHLKISIPKKDLKGNFPTIGSFHKVSSLNNIGLKELREEIKKNIPKIFTNQISRNNKWNKIQIGHLLSNDWIKIKKELEKKQKNKVDYFDINQYFKLCSANDIDEENGLAILQYLHNCGTIIFFQKPSILEDFIILNPNWLKNVVYEVISSKEIIEQAGVLTEQVLNRIWTEKDIGYTEKRKLRTLLEKMGICFKIEDKQSKEEQYIFPEFLASDLPDSKLITSLKSSKDKFNCEFHFSPVLPTGFASRLMVILSDYLVEKEFCKQAFMIELDYLSGRALIEQKNTLINQNILSLFLVGRDKEKLFDKIYSDIHKTHKEYFNKSQLDFDVKVPCSCNLCKKQHHSSKDRYYYSMKFLEASQRNNISQVICPKWHEIVELHSLLQNTFLFRNVTSSFPEEKNINSMKIIKIFLASSYELKKERDEIEKWIRRENDERVKQGRPYLELVMWEYLSLSIETDRKQDYYNKNVADCDVFLGLFGSKVGIYSEEEFRIAFKTMKEKNRPSKVYTFFRKLNTLEDFSDKDLRSRLNFREYLTNELKQFLPPYSSSEDLISKLKDEVNRYFPD